MANRYWVGGTASWDGTAGTKWATTSGGTGGASVPTSADDVFFDAASGANTITISTGNTGAKSINCTGFTGTITGTANITVNGSITLVSGMTWTHTGTKIITATATLITAGKTFGHTTINAPSATVQLGDSLTLGTTVSAGFLTLTAGTFQTNNYTVTINRLDSSATGSARTLDLGSSTLSANGSFINFGVGTNLTINAGTSQINMSGSTAVAFTGGGKTFYNLAFTGTGGSTVATINSVNTFNNLSSTALTSSGIKIINIAADQTVNGTLTLSAGTNAAYRTFICSDTIGTTRTLTCAAVASLTDIDFRDITITGAAAPVSGTRLGDCKGNSGITFDAPKTVYWVQGSPANWSQAAWSDTLGGTANVIYFPLAQDTAVIGNSFPSTGQTVTINAAYNIGTIDMSARTSNTMTLATGTQTPTIYGNWINGTGTTLTGTGRMTFAGRGSQTITSAGKTFTQAFTIESPSGSVTLQDAFTTNVNVSAALRINAGTFDAATYNVTFSGASATVDLSSSTLARTVAVGSGTWTIPSASSSAWGAATSTNLTVTGTGTISLTSSSAKTFAGGGIQTYPTLNQGGTGTLTVTGSNKFANLTNTAIGRIQFTGGTTNIFDSFNISGTSGNLLQLGSTNTTQATLQKGSAWLMGANSTDGGNNTGLSFTAGGGIDYLSVSYINGTVVAPPATSTGNFFFFF